MTRKEFNLRRERMKRNLTQVNVADGVPTDIRTYQRHEAADKIKPIFERAYKNYFDEFDKK